eukprot:NODE_4193_length_1102_cov_81.683350_g3995_i0.p2 GENE.NODE_4193_length_1102_cov_81.683350_g3995_i0~~NODE_4193_length_1102_cov_81.683350_g3995_i0.p2  ORF type:complete len:197 (+),score=18.53 NODE_4193_length_1102_cov_81.683350_g3995_i0:504-1094(+)
MDGGHVNHTINLHKEMITEHNVVDLFEKYNVPSNPDLVTIDVDSLDAWITRRLLNSTYRPRVLMVEYNPNFPLNVSLTVGRDSGRWFTMGKHTAVFGASLACLRQIGEEAGYTLVHVVHRLDAIFVRNDLIGSHRTQSWIDFTANTCVATHYDRRHAEPLYLLWDYSVYAATKSKKQARLTAMIQCRQLCIMQHMK